MKYVYSLCFLFLFVACSGDFVLAEPKTVTNDELDTKDLLYHYLTSNYDSINPKKNVQKLNYSPYILCAFDQEFTHGLSFSTESCGEASGINIRVLFPPVSKKEITKWIERFEKSRNTNFIYKWNQDKTKYYPSGEEAGCFYDLEKVNQQWKLTIYCGC